MNDAYNKYKSEYDAIDEQIAKLHEKQNQLLESMREVCPHKKLIDVVPDPYDFEAEQKYKCKTCYRYFTETEAKALRGEQKRNSEKPSK